MAYFEFSHEDWAVLGAAIDLLKYDGAGCWHVKEATCYDWGELWSPALSPVFLEMDRKGERLNAF
jgi:hypothetical protein